PRRSSPRSSRSRRRSRGARLRARVRWRDWGCDRYATDSPRETAGGVQVIDLIGAGNRIRTYDPRITNALLYQLSYPGAGGGEFYRLALLPSSGAPKAASAIVAADQLALEEEGAANRRRPATPHGLRRPSYGAG